MLVIGKHHTISLIQIPTHIDKKHAKSYVEKDNCHIMKSVVVTRMRWNLQIGWHKTPLTHAQLMHASYQLIGV